jgi:hypothetical protein
MLGDPYLDLELANSGPANTYRYDRSIRINKQKLDADLGHSTDQAKSRDIQSTV